MTDEEARKAGILRLDDKQVAALPAASWLMNNEKLRELLARGKKKGKLDSADLMDAVDDLNLESDQMDQLYDSPGGAEHRHQRRRCPVGGPAG